MSSLSGPGLTHGSLFHLDKWLSDSQSLSPALSLRSYSPPHHNHLRSENRPPLSPFENCFSLTSTTYTPSESYVSPVVRTSQTLSHSPPTPSVNESPIIERLQASISPKLAPPRLLTISSNSCTPFRYSRCSITSDSPLTPLTPLTPASPTRKKRLRSLESPSPSYRSRIKRNRLVMSPTTLPTSKKLDVNCTDDSNLDDLPLSLPRSHLLLKLCATSSASKDVACSSSTGHGPSNCTFIPPSFSKLASTISLSSPDIVDATSIPNRIFPSHIPIYSYFFRFYRRFPASSHFISQFQPINRPHGRTNTPSTPMTLYTPRLTRHTGPRKLGLCPICIEPLSRGGEGREVWKGMKVSAYKCYHMQYYHGISPITHLPFSPPISFRITPRPSAAAKQQRTEIIEGKCHQCLRWIALEGVKDVDAKVKELFWWKHAAVCHQGSTIPGEEGCFIEDNVWRAVRVL